MLEFLLEFGMRYPVYLLQLTSDACLIVVKFF
jgi:hypothetical protein